MRRKFCMLFVLFLFLGAILLGNTGFINVNADVDKIYLGGIPAGFSIKTRGAHIVGLCDVITENGLKTPSKDADLCVGDVIIKIDGCDVNGASDIEENIKAKDKILLTVRRNDDEMSLYVNPAKDISGNNKIGVFIKEDISGIGTITYIKGKRLASLGHPVVDENGKTLEILSGQIFTCNVTGCLKGERGKAGELRGVFLKNNPISSIDKNLQCGVYGDLYNGYDYKNLKEVEIGEAKPGKAEFYTTIDGVEPCKYSVSIIKIDNFDDNKNFVLKVDDERLMSLSGGIVQGMSGSPIVQDGKLVGAITHVFINDPTRGFGISIANMLNN